MAFRAVRQMRDTACPLSLEVLETATGHGHFPISWAWYGRMKEGMIILSFVVVMNLGGVLSSIGLGILAASTFPARPGLDNHFNYR